jgi:hypothetical protein
MSVPEIITVNSEALQTQIRDLLPSQNGFGSELQASNVITPIIDLTAAAEGSGLPQVLQQSLAYGSNTPFIANNGTVSLANSPGFYRVVGTITTEANITGTDPGGSLQITDGATPKIMYQFQYVDINASIYGQSGNIDLIFWLKAGETLNAVSNDAQSNVMGSVRQVADGSGSLVQPQGFPL